MTFLTVIIKKIVKIVSLGIDEGNQLISMMKFLWTGLFILPSLISYKYYIIQEIRAKKIAYIYITAVSTSINHIFIPDHIAFCEKFLQLVQMF